jgi:lipopolysaccharide/colanic/teichoic acid biosynthesis glycosyltransferase
VTRRRLFIKRVTDLVGSGSSLVILSPILAGCAIAVRATSGSPVIFRQIRIGRNEKPFEILKFRTMRAPLPAQAMYDSDAERVTSVGRFLRATSLDELPELWNVWRGEMSLVGPRPLLPEYLSVYTDVQRRRHDVKPGITGMAQIAGRQSLTLSQRLALDVQYVETWSLVLDLRILLRTLPLVWRRQGVLTGQAIADVDDIGVQATLGADTFVPPNDP